MMKRKFLFLSVLIVGIVGVVVFVSASMVMNRHITRLNMALLKVKTDLIYAREFAMNHNCRSRVKFLADKESYKVYYELSAGSWNVAQDPTTKKRFNVKLNKGLYEGVVIEDAYFDGGPQVLFDANGVPHAYNKGQPLLRGYVTIKYVGSAIYKRTSSVNIAPTTGRIYIE